MTSTQYLQSRPGVTIFGTSPLTENHFNIPNETIVQIACGDKHCLIVCESGRVFAFGDNSKGQCGLDPKDIVMVKSPTFVESLGSYKVVRVACGARSSFFVTCNGELFVCGSNKMGELGHELPCALPVRIGHSLNVVSVSAAGSHFMVITDAGKVHVCGDNWSGQLGLGHSRSQTSLIDVKFPEVMKKVVCGVNFNVALSRSGKLYTTDRCILSDNDNREEKSFDPVQSPEEVDLDEDSVDPLPSIDQEVVDREENSFYPISSIGQEVVDVACGNCHSVMLLKDGTVRGFGGNFCGQLGTNNVVCYKHALVQSTVPAHISVADLYASMNRSALVSKGGNVYLWGGGYRSILSQSTDILIKPMIVNKASNVMVKQVAFCDEFGVFWCKLKPRSSSTLISSNLTELEESVMASLECPVCCKIMFAPIHMCIQGHNLCSSCKLKVMSCPQCRSNFSNARNYTLESMCTELRLPCVQCSERMPVAALEFHVDVCPARQRRCPLNDECRWTGNTRNVLEHLTEAHADDMWHGSPHEFEFSHTGVEPETRAWLVDDDVFILYWKYDGEARVFTAAAKQIGAYYPRLKHKLELKFTEADKNINTTMSGVGVDTDRIEDIFTSSACTKTNVYKNFCQVAILNREKCDKIAEQIEALASIE